VDKEATSAELQPILDEAIETNRLHAWEQFAHCAQPIIASTIFRVLSRWRSPRNDYVDDLVQETFVKLCANDYHSLRRFRSTHPGALAAYLRAIASTVVVDAYRGRAAQKRGSDRDPVDGNDFTLSPASVQGVEQVERQLLIERIDRCLSSQKERDRNVFWLYYRQGLTADAIANIRVMELSSSGVESLLRRLALAVRKCLRITLIGEVPQTAKGNS
jgi:RNA polymerase sigma-70 factor (ECF subfamily)